MKRIYLKQGAAALTLLSASIALSHADTDVAQLQQQVVQLEQSLKQLKTELSRIQSADQAKADGAEEADENLTADAGAETGSESSLEAEDDQSFVTRAELQGLQSDLENYKYQVQRERDTKTALSTRQLLINGVVQTKASYIDEPQVTQPQGANTGNAVNSRRSSGVSRASRLAASTVSSAKSGSALSSSGKKVLSSCSSFAARRSWSQ